MRKPVFSVRTIEGENVATVTYPDGSMFTTMDWQGPQPEIEEEIPAYTWYKVNPANPSDTAQWTPAVVMYGYPRSLV